MPRGRRRRVVASVTVRARRGWPPAPSSAFALSPVQASRQGDDAPRWLRLSRIRRRMDPQEEEEVVGPRVMAAYGGPARAVESAAGETMLLWALGQPAAHRQNAFVRHGACFAPDACA